MPDHGAQYTDKRIAEVEARIIALYETAYADVKRRYQKYIVRFLKKDRELRQLLADGKITKATYDAWLRGQVFQGKRWKAQLADLAQTLTDTTQRAMDIVNDSTANVFAMNANYAEYEIEKAGNIDMGFGLYDENTVRRLVRDNPALLPPSRVNIPREQQWNTQLITRQIGVSIVIGEGIEAAAARLQRAVQMSTNQARTHARTALTGAQNAGRIEGYHKAQALDIKMEKEWLATLDTHTRHSHRLLDGKHVPVDEPFESILGAIRYPGDPLAHPGNVYNCRCTLIARLLEYPSENAKRRPNEQQLGDADVQKPIKDMTYTEWAKMKQKQAPAPKPKPAPKPNFFGRSIDGYTPKQQAAMVRLMDAAPDEVKRLFGKYSNQLQEPDENVDPQVGVAYFSPSDGRVHMHRADAAAGGNAYPPFGMHFHEYGHNLDHLAGRLSTSWRDANGNSFEDIIESDWKKTLKDFFKLSPDHGYMQAINDQLGFGGLGGEEYIGQMLINWRKTNGISRYDIRYTSLRDELYALNGTKKSYRNYWLNHFDTFSDLVYNDARVQSETIGEFCDYMKTNYSLLEIGDLSDMFERYAIRHGGDEYEYPFDFGHGKDYSLRSGSLAREAFAEMTSASVTSSGSLTLIKQYLPNAYQAYLDMLRSVN